MTREEEKEVVKGIIVVEDQKKEKAKITRLGIFGVGSKIIWQPNALLTKKHLHQDAETVGWTTPLASARTDVSPITRKLRKRKIRNSKYRERLKHSL